ncbi:hypothetical protein E_074 [Cronobacter phage vB_CsaM_leE]|uniref:Uncharacterized protein n=1 Tax=Cronobacter phage vB_CsaM_leE TaxID=1873954 RepID=A0A1W5P0F4_9CAUD|nr:hypothetical protein HWB01_gp074 [Cronobacter phage vB_CsaM_leE]AON97083.1 hypothetical protein E_074 [Cronobacter phage vB_CsaM_leE]WFD55739.1 hypothetical protein phi5_259 [Enterobacter phage phi5]
MQKIKIRITEVDFFSDLTVGKVYDATRIKDQLWICSDWSIFLDLHTYANRALIEYEIVK